MNTKYIKITILILIIIIISSVLIIYIKNKDKNTEIINTTRDQEQNINTNILKDRVNSTSSVKINDYSETSKTVEGDDVDLRKKIKENLENWQITKDKKLLEDSLNLTKGTDNESVLDAWSDFIPKNTNELMLLIDTSINKKETEQTIKLILDWYINLSGNYEKLSNQQKLFISNQYKLLK